MVKEVTLDSSVLVSAFVKGDEFRPEARRIMEKMFSGQYHVVTSATVFVEVCGAICRRVGVDKALLVKNHLAKWGNMNFIAWSGLTKKRMEQASELAVKLKLRGIDAIVIQVAKEKKRTLITFDEEIARKAKAAVEVFPIKHFNA